MPITKISEFSATAGSNTDINSVDISEGCPPSNINNALRSLGGLLKDMDAGTQPLTSPSLTSATITSATITTGSITTPTLGGLTYPTADSTNGKILQTNGSGAVSFSSLVYPTSDGSANQVLQTNGSGVLSFGTLATPDTIPSGVIVPYGGTSAPTDWLFCYGQLISRTTYSALFTAIGTTYSVGDGSSTFGLPDLRGRTVAGKDDMGSSSANRLTDQTGGLNGDTLGASGGSETHTLTSAQMPSHTHTTNIFSAGGQSLSSRYFLSSSSSSVSETEVTTDATGSGSAHNNVQPTFILNYIIKV